VNTDLRDVRAKRLVDCAKDAFAARGYYSTSISNIVERAGIARGTFYQYFDNKPHIFQSILDSFLHDLRGCIRRIDLGPHADSPLIQIQDNLTRVLELVLRERALSQMLLNHVTTSDRQIDEQVANFYDQIVEMMEHSLELGIAMKLVRPCDTRLTTYSIIGAIKEVVLYLTSSDRSQPRVEDLVQEFLQFGLGGILAVPQEILREATGPTKDIRVGSRA
jgi:AcrR family transcriptional regulator